MSTAGEKIIAPAINAILCSNYFLLWWNNEGNPMKQLDEPLLLLLLPSTSQDAPRKGISATTTRVWTAEPASTCGAPSAATVHSDLEGKTAKGVSESRWWKRVDGTRDLTQIGGRFLKLRPGLSRVWSCCSAGQNKESVTGVLNGNAWLTFRHSHAWKAELLSDVRVSLLTRSDVWE